MRINFSAYVAGMFLAALASAAAGLVAGGFIAYFLSTYLWVKAVLPLGVALLAGSVALTVLYFYPKVRADSRKRKLNEEFPYVVGHMAVLAAAGMTPEGIFQSIAEEESNDVVNEEARMIVRDMSLLGMDLTASLEAERSRSPSESFAEFLDGFIAASSAGADIRAFLVRAAEGTMEDRRIKARQFGETVGVISEMYTILLVVAPLILIVMFSVMGIIAGSLGGISIILLIELVAFGLVPVGGIMVLVMADSVMPKR